MRVHRVDRRQASRRFRFPWRIKSRFSSFGVEQMRRVGQCHHGGPIINLQADEIRGSPAFLRIADPQPPRVIDIPHLPVGQQSQRADPAATAAKRNVATRDPCAINSATARASRRFSAMVPRGPRPNQPAVKTRSAAMRPDFAHVPRGKRTGTFSSGAKPMAVVTKSAGMHSRLPSALKRTPRHMLCAFDDRGHEIEAKTQPARRSLAPLAVNGLESSDAGSSTGIFQRERSLPLCRPVNGNSYLSKRRQLLEHCRIEPRLPGPPRPTISTSRTPSFRRYATRSECEIRAGQFLRCLQQQPCNVESNISVPDDNNMRAELWAESSLVRMAVEPTSEPSSA